MNKKSMTLVALALLLLTGADARGQKEKEPELTFGKPPSTHVNPTRGRFRITLNGFTCGQPTADDNLQRDGVDDEVFLMTTTVLFDGRSVRSQPSGRSPVIGDTNNQALRIRGGSGHNVFGGNGGFKAGDSFPTSQPWVRSPTFSGESVPLLVWEGELISGGNGIVVVPSIWEHDNRPRAITEEQRNRDQLHSQWLGAHRAVMDMAVELNSLFTDPAGRYEYHTAPPPDMAGAAARWRGRRTEAQARIEEAYKSAVVAQDINRNDQDRPIGMRRLRGDTFDFRPQAFVITYEVADYLARSNTSFGEGVIQIHYVEEDLRAGYILYMQIERLP